MKMLIEVPIRESSDSFNLKGLILVEKIIVRAPELFFPPHLPTISIIVSHLCIITYLVKSNYNSYIGFKISFCFSQ